MFSILTKTAAAALLTTGLLIASGAQAQEDPIKVGIIFPLSGGTGPQGQHVNWAIEAMAKMINEDGGVMGRQLRLISRDDESTPAVGVSRASELISEGVDVIIEGWNSSVTLAMQPLIARAGIMDITAISKADTILSGNANPLAVRMNSSNVQDGLVIAKYIAEQGAKRIAFLTENDVYGTGAQASIEGALKDMGYEYEKVAEELFPFDQAGFRVQLTNVKFAKPDITVAINANEGLGMPAIIRQAKRSRLPGILVAAVGTVAPSVIEVAGDASEGLVSADFYFPNTEPFASNKVNQRFVAYTEKLHDYTPDKYMALGAISLQVWAMAANEAGSLEKEIIATRIRGGSFDNTILGNITFGDNGQLDSNHYIFDVTDQKIVVRSATN